MNEAFNDQQAQARGMSVTSGPVGETGATLRTLPGFPRISGVENEQRYPPPELGEHTSKLLLEAGYSDKEIGEFKAGGVV
jgi:crotonobetainyl-CoA:carnitine CoA-transferase CaiB-like acyl-CoA transferase